MYLYDLKTGALKRPLTSGEWVVKDIVSCDAIRREIFIQTMGRVAGRDPYYADLARVNIDTGNLVTVIASNDHYYTVCDQYTDFQAATARIFGRNIDNSSGISTSGNFSVVTRSRADKIPESLLLGRDGQTICELEQGDLSTINTILPNQWTWPEPVTLTAADGKTDVYGLVFRPSDFDINQCYPVIDYAFTCPDLPLVPKGSFTNNEFYGRSYLEPAALAELGFIVVIIDGRGTPFRSKAFLDECYGWAESASNLSDHVKGIQQLAELYPYMDLDRVGISSLIGGFAAVHGLLHFPDFYKVGVGANFYDSRLLPSIIWGDKFEGGGPNTSEHQYLESMADKLEGKLLMLAGMLDDVTPPATTFRMVSAFQQANKDIDLITLPNVGHGVNSYLIRRSWDYLIENLQGIDPPKEFTLTTARDL